MNTEEHLLKVLTNAEDGKFAGESVCRVLAAAALYLGGKLDILIAIAKGDEGGADS